MRRFSHRVLVSRQEQDQPRPRTVGASGAPSPNLLPEQCRKKLSMSLFRVVLILLAAIALTGVSRSIEVWAPAIEVSMRATWQNACGRTFVKQHAIVTNHTVKDLCFTKLVCGSDKLLKIEDDQGVSVAYGLSCGRSASGDRIEDPSSLFVVLRHGDSHTFYRGGAASIVTDLDSPEQPLKKDRRYRGHTEIGYARCSDVKRICPDDLCRWSNLERVTTWERVANVAVTYVGTWCPKGFDPWDDLADPPVPKLK